jgi:hypothetical protein
MGAEGLRNPLARGFCKLRDRSAIPRILRRAFYRARDWFRLQVIAREYTQLALSFNAVRCEVGTINRKNYGKAFSLSQIHERAIGKIHGSIPIARHQTVHVLQFRIFDCTEDQCSGTDEPPGGLHLRARIANEVEQFGENSRRGLQGKA